MNKKSSNQHCSIQNFKRAETHPSLGMQQLIAMGGMLHLVLSVMICGVTRTPWRHLATCDTKLGVGTIEMYLRAQAPLPKDPRRMPGDWTQF